MSTKFNNSSANFQNFCSNYFHIYLHKATDIQMPFTHKIHFFPLEYSTNLTSKAIQKEKKINFKVNQLDHS